MDINKEIARQIARIENIQDEVFQRKPSAEDAERPEAMRKERAANLRNAIKIQRKRRDEVISRMDAEIKDLEAELNSLESKSDIALGGLSGKTNINRQPTSTERDTEGENSSKDKAQKE
ncbi:MAG: hypothetical protein WBB25_00650 [Sulfitobacter sp.]